MSDARPAAVTAWEQLPLVLTVQDMARLLPFTVGTIRKKCQARTMFPAPTTWARPYIWSRDTVRADIESGYQEPARGRRRPAPVSRQVARVGPTSSAAAGRLAREVLARIEGREAGRG